MAGKLSGKIYRHKKSCVQNILLIKKMAYTSLNLLNNMMLDNNSLVFITTISLFLFI